MMIRNVKKRIECLQLEKKISDLKDAAITDRYSTLGTTILY